MTAPTLARYQPRPVRSIGLFLAEGWRIKAYSISVRQERVDQDVVDEVYRLVPRWLTDHAADPLPTYGIGTLIVHEAREGCFAILSRWTDSNMLRTHVYLASDDERRDFHLFSGGGIFTCVWELAVHWHERNAWVRHVLSAPPDASAFDRYLNDHLNIDL